jgi:hypothetical protein
MKSDTETKAPERSFDIERYIFETDLPADILKSTYDEWFKRSRIVDGVRMGPDGGASIGASISMQDCLKVSDEMLILYVDSYAGGKPFRETQTLTPST